MTRYALTEAYSEIYDHRKAEDLFDNLRFVDYMLDEDIEEVIESLVWEFRDYGNTLDESFNLLYHAASDEVICESYDQLVEDILTEATVTYGRGDVAPKQKRAGMRDSQTDSPTTYGRGDVLAQQRAARQLARRSGQAVASRAADSDQRRETRRSRVDGAISRVKAAMAGAKGGMGRVAKAMGGAIAKTPGLAAKAAEKGKSLLGSLLRRGARAAGRALTSTGRAIEGSGRQAAAATPTTRTARVGRTTVTATTEPGGAKRQAVGRAIRRVGAALQRGGKGTRMSRADYDQRKADREASAKAAVGDAFAKPKALPAARPETETRRAAVQRKLDTAAAGTTGTETRVSRPRLALPATTSGQPAVQRRDSSRKKAAAEKLAKAAAGTQARGTRFAGPSGQLDTTRTRTGYRERLARFGRKLTAEDYEALVDAILEDIISTGYAVDESSALDVLEQLSENTVIDIALEYLVD